MHRDGQPMHPRSRFVFNRLRSVPGGGSRHSDTPPGHAGPNPERAISAQQAPARSVPARPPPPGPGGVGGREIARRSPGRGGTLTRMSCRDAGSASMSWTTSWRRPGSNWQASLPPGRSCSARRVNAARTQNERQAQGLKPPVVGTASAANGRYRNALRANSSALVQACDGLVECRAECQGRCAGSIRSATTKLRKVTARTSLP